MPPIVQIQVTRAPGDCAVVALSMYLGRPYEDVFAVAVSVTKNTAFHKTGLYYSHIRRIATKLGARLLTQRPRVAYPLDLETACGLLGIKRRSPDDQHVVFIKAGLVFDFDGTVWEFETYLKHHGYTVVCLLTNMQEEE